MAYISDTEIKDLNSLLDFIIQEANTPVPCKQSVGIFSKIRAVAGTIKGFFTPKSLEMRGRSVYVFPLSSYPHRDAESVVKLRIHDTKNVTVPLLVERLNEIEIQCIMALDTFTYNCLEFLCSTKNFKHDLHTIINRLLESDLIAAVSIHPVFNSYDRTLGNFVYSVFASNLSTGLPITDAIYAPLEDLIEFFGGIPFETLKPCVELYYESVLPVFE